MIERVSYAAAFGATALICVVAVYRAGWLRTDDASVGLRALLVIVGLWSAVQSAQFLAPDSLLEPLYIVGQVTGFASVGAWLYFCSAYTGRQYHRQRRYWIAGLATYGAVSTIKLTQPLHRSYVETRVVADPFRYLLVDPEPLYWAVLSGAYLLSAVGFYWLFELLSGAERSTAGVGIFVSAAGLASLPTVLSLFRPRLLAPVNYEPLGVAVFAFGVLYLVESTFLAVHRDDRYGQRADG